MRDIGAFFYYAKKYKKNMAKKVKISGKTDSLCNSYKEYEYKAVNLLNY
ncbi:hypothetical protein EDC18_106141 [Natranaerovirga pectinivora]|uniref:Uncharacterized protein n=1 Tax=Natranaerovirga pectinivora TaxID=682400 RepID=A0A4R3MKV2_9FIRM|nr:hypothetical protein EDC18_106141 [Natranaerovirga pectinivora]